MDSSSNLSYTAAAAASTPKPYTLNPKPKQLHFPPPATPKSNVKKRLGWNPKQQLPNEQDSGALSRSQAEANNPMSDSASSTSSDVSTTASLNGSSSSLQSVHGISSNSADNSQSTPRVRQGNSTLQDPTLELQAGEYLFLITTFCAFTCNKFYVF
jgi:hypothetical protein